jgi:hypothetical protein
MADILTRHIPRPVFDEELPNAFHQADLLFLPYDNISRKIYKYALTVVDVASRYKDAEPLTDKSATGVAAAFTRIYKRGPLIWPRLLQVDARSEFKGEFTQLLAKHIVQPNIHRQQGIVSDSNELSQIACLEPNTPRNYYSLHTDHRSARNGCELCLRLLQLSMMSLHD